MDSTDITYIVECAQKGNELPFTTFFDHTFQKLKSKLLSLTKSKNDSQEVFIISMQKFWERFVINQEEPPHNSIGYIYMMCKNAWLMQKRNKANNMMSIEESPEFLYTKEIDVQSNTIEEVIANEGEELLKHQTLAEALKLLSSKCRALIENELDNDRQLKDLQEEFGYNNYQALVQAKYNCKKRLILKVYEVMVQLKNQKKLET
ncbi:RNA polymerase sigma factor [Aquimarina sp. 2304DJ70-9]|uniref:RNA polymerase sigma factor n=1 Tax=Aquimarina penaris TaxID=3231044 RepID=UPI00346299E3